MKYKINHPYLPYVMDGFLTGSYGEDSFNEKLYCSSCGEPIPYGSEYYSVGDNVYCLRCQYEADTAILDEVRENYIYEL